MPTACGLIARGNAGEKPARDRNRYLNTAFPRHFLTLRFEAGLRAREFWRIAFPRPGV